MHSHFLDTYSHLNSPLHRLPASLKTVLALATVIILVIVPPSPIWFCMVGLALVMIAAMSRIPGSFLAKRLITLEPFVLGAAALALFQPHGGIRFLEVASRSTLCLFTLVLLANTTPFSELLATLRRWRVPSIMLTILALMYRYLYVLKDESARMRSARASRTFRRDKRFAWSAMATIIAQLFVRSAARSERVYAAMCARGWQ